MTLLETIIIAIVEGITEFLPVSSTGHMIITQKLLGVESTPFTLAFIVSIQFGTILSVVVLYWKRFFQSIDFYFRLFVAFIPSAVLGFLLKHHIDDLLNSVETVAVSLLLGGVFLVFVDRWLNPQKEATVTYPRALRIGLFQCISMIPGVSRSAATIIGGMVNGLTRKQAAEFSFFLAVPTMFGAATLELYEAYSEVPELFDQNNLQMLAIGNLVGFIVAVIAIRFLINFLTKHGFRAFGWYRIIVGGVILILLALGVDLQVV